MKYFNLIRSLLVLPLILTTSLMAQTNVGGTIAIDSTFSVGNSPYIVTDNLTISDGVTVTIESGVTVKVADGRSINVFGTLTADGATITSNSASPAAGKWSNLLVGDDTHTGHLNLTNCIVEYANKISLPYAVATINSTTIQNFTYYGLELFSGTDLTLNSSTISNTGYLLYFVSPAKLTVNTANTFVNSTGNYACIAFGEISSDWTLPSLSIPYRAWSNIYVNNGSSLTTKSGVSLEFNNGRSLFVYGTLNSNNTTFTASADSPSPGAWSYLNIGQTDPYDASQNFSGSAVLTDCLVEYANNVNIIKGDLTLVNTDLSNFQYHGVYTQDSTTLSVNGGSISTSSNTAYTNNYYGIYVNDYVSVSLSDVSINGFNCGLNMAKRSGSTLLNGCAFSGLVTPILFQEPASLTVNTSNTFSDNEYNHAWISFSSLTTDWSLPRLSIPYDFNSGFDIKSGATFTASSSNIFKIRDGNAFDVHGVLKAVAEPDENIYFTAFSDDNWGGDSNGDDTNSAAARYSWTGVRFYNNEASASELNGCKIRFTGKSSSYYDYGSVTCYNSSPTIDSCEFSNNKYGITLSGASSPTVTNTTFASSSQTPIAMSFEADPVFENNTLSFSDNAYDAIGLLGGTITADATIRKRNFTDIDNITYYMLDDITVPDGKKLTINPGVVLKAHSGREIYVEGTILANGTEDEHIIFTSGSDDNYGNPGDTNKDGTQAVPAVGHIGGIQFKASSSDTSSVSFCEFRYSNGAAIYTYDASPTITNNSFIQATDALKFYGASNPVFTNNELVNISGVPVIVSSAADPTFEGNTFNNVGLSALGLQGGDVTQSGTLRKKDLAGYENITYVLMSTMTIKDGTYVDIEPGVVLKMGESHYNSILVEGGFRAVGTEDEKVIITSYKDDNFGNPKDVNGDGNATSPSQDNWGSVRFLSSSDDDSCRLENVEIRYGGYYSSSTSNLQTAIYIENANTKITDVLLFQTGGYGINILGNSVPVIDNVIIQNSSWDPVGMSLTSDPQFSNMTFLANRSQGLAINDRTLATNATLAQRDVASIENIAYVLNSSLTIASNSTLTIQPGVVLKPKGGIYVNGALVANGSKNEKITFTSIADDSRGGDTDNNGNNAVPGAGNWSGIYFYASGLDSLNCIKHAELRYGNTALSFENCSADVDSCTLEQLYNNPISINGSASPSVSNCEMMNCRGLYLPGIGAAEFKNNQLLNITDAPVRTCTFSEATYEGNTMANIGIQAIELLPETYSQTDTIPFRNFAGYDSITYYLDDNIFTINNGTEITIPAGMVFKGAHNNDYVFNVNGKLIVDGSANDPVIFTDIEDDNCGNPLDTKRNGNTTPYWNDYSWFKFNNVSDDESAINYAHIKYMSGDAIKLYSASPNINNCLFEKCNQGIYCNGVSEPKLRNNTFHNLSTVPFSMSLVAYPAVLENNVISGTTLKMIEVNYETLTQDLNLPQRSFAGIENIPYYFSSYTVGSGAVLTIDPGVICKISGAFYVNKGLLAKGGSTPDSMIIFTSIGDDFYGGDSNSDGDGSEDYWGGIDFSNTSIDADCQLEHCVFKNISGDAIYTNSANPTIMKSTFENVRYEAIKSEGASEPVIDSCDFVHVSYYSTYYDRDKAVNNVHKTFTIDATNCWWGNASGPTHSSNPEGSGAGVTDDVNFMPFVTKVNNPQLGDVSRNGALQAYDASLILLSTVGDTVLDTKQSNVANVSGNTGENAVSAYDASLILQKVVGIISYFGEGAVEVKSSSLASLAITSVTAPLDDDISVPLVAAGLSNAYALQTQIEYDSSVLSFKGITKTDFTDGISVATHQEGNVVNISMAGTEAFDNSGTVVNLIFEKVAASNSNIESTEIKLNKFIVNESDMSAYASSGDVLFDGPTNLSEQPVENFSFKAYPNPFDQEIRIDYTVNTGSKVRIAVYNVYGQLVGELVNMDQEKGAYSTYWRGDGNDGQRLEAGLYLICLTNGEQKQVLKVQMY